ncbi:PREDICTED: protein MEI2-like 1 [Tarenaya hassleriana]|uniref:protein MEI2-like 1 n=1 Tax=Tarenaya hassleriana TaxID=28532 RepID=UPI00053C85F3|nr:PREDICTED: protein MEI2-like 1 [Tarenaya hassleriana]XP_010546098.1 PREDICTED: protein MEI2-like 1 [Tarenaya hassleriana]XP_010546099.1 PREDICTED: protein MEI2-like 1 [Tarenaya hassleriana]XP_010546100.1 PREDICTED: protein MEI2-like 1 [Tarenaya hassleriana]XP_010546101.1 PREDICTED: protein MEI2-like 1 [Tarenaya hassleriana]
MMPSDMMDHHFHEEVRHMSERQFGFRKTNLMLDNKGGGDRPPNLSRSPWTSENYQLKPQSSMSLGLPSVNPNGKTTTIDTEWESSLFSSSLSELFSRKLRLQRSDMLASQPVNTAASHREIDEPFESLEEIEAQTIGSLLPDEDDLFAEVVGEIGRKSQANNGDDLDDFDLFSSVGGLELDGDVRSSGVQINFDVMKVPNGDFGGNVSIIGEHPQGEIPSRTLFVRNINSNVEDYDLKALFEQYGDIRALYTACKNRGFIMISYYDIRAAQNAMRALQDKLLWRRKLDIHFSIPKENLSEEDINQGALLVNNLDTSISREELQRIFVSYGEIKEIRKTTHENQQIYIEFYDIRAAKAALRGLNGSEIAGKWLKVAPAQAEGTRNISSTHIGRNFPGIIASSSIDGGSMRSLHCSIRSPVHSLAERHQSLNIPIAWPSSASVISASKPIGLQEPNHPFDNLTTGIQSMPNLYPHSLPEYHDNFVGGSPYNSKTYSEMVSDGAKPNDGFMTNKVRGAVADGFNAGVIGSPMSESAHRANHVVWSNTHQPSLTSGMMWPNSPSHVNSIPQRIPTAASFSRAPSLMVNMSSSPVQHHIGSAPVMNSPFWDRRQPFVAESPESSGFHLGSHRSMGFPGSSPSHPMEIASQKIFAHVVGNRIDLNAANAVMRSPQQMPNLFPGRNPMVSMPGSFDSPTERYRTLSHRRSDPGSTNADKKQYELDIDRILHGEDSRTTLMIKNIPNKYTSKMLLAAIDEYCKGTYDFLYLPIDFKNKCNVGYAFINLIDPKKIIPFHKAFDGKKWEKFNSEKVAYLAYARIQGKTALVSHFQNSSLMNEDKRCRPILFHTDGPNAGDQEPFPMGTSIRSRPGKPRMGSIDSSYSNNHSSSSVLENREEPPNGTDSSCMEKLTDGQPNPIHPVD